MDDIMATQHSHGRLKTIGWMITILGMGLWLYGYFTEDGAMLVDWSRHVPAWAAAFVPNWQAELGFALSLIGMVPIYYVEYLQFTVGDSSYGGAAAKMIPQEAAVKKAAQESRPFK